MIRFYYFLQTLGFWLIKLKHVAACLNTGGVKTKPNRIALGEWRHAQCNMIDNMIWFCDEWVNEVTKKSVLEICILESG